MQLNHSFWDGANAQEITEKLTPAKGLNETRGELWRLRAIMLVNAVTRIAVHYRDHGIIELSTERLRELLKLETLERIAWQSPERLLFYPQIKADLKQLQGVLLSLPAYDKARIGQQAQATRNQFNFLAGQLIEQLDVLSREQDPKTLTP